MSQVNFYKTTSLPGTLVANSFYYVENGTYAESYVTDDAGQARMIGNSVMITAIAQALVNAANSAKLHRVADIPARNALPATFTGNLMALVTDASADPTVTAGAALYFYEDATDTWTKVAEYESMDAIINWSDIVGRPSSTPAAIDAAVTNSHTHLNKPTLDQIGSINGRLAFNGQLVQRWEQTDW